MRFFIPSGRGGATIPSMDPQWAPTILRVHVGLAFLLYHGAHKVAELASGGSRFMDAVAALGFPAPLLFAWLAAGVQTVAAVLLLVGLASRLAALALAGTMFVALLETWPAGYLASEAALLYALLGALLAATGPGRLALENLHDRPVSRAPTGNPSPDHSRNGTLQSVQTISIEELREQLATGGVDEFWNVLTDEYFSGELIPGSRRVPLDRVGRELAGSSIAKDAAIVVYCAGPHCPQSDQAAKKLATFGFTNVRAYEGGIQEWKEAGLALQQVSRDATAA